MATKSAKAIPMTQKGGIQAIDQQGILLVFPINNRPEPASLWSCFFPRSEMRWEWDEGGDNRVGALWHLRGELSTARKVVYTKWYQGRATYFSRPIFAAMLRRLNPQGPSAGLSAPAREALARLQEESPLSTKELKKRLGLKGREHEATYQRTLKELWSRLLIVAYGEVDDGAFPSLAVGGTEALFEDLWREAWSLDPAQADARIRTQLGPANLFFKYYLKLARRPLEAALTVAPSASAAISPPATSSRTRSTNAPPGLTSASRAPGPALGDGLSYDELFGTAQPRTARARKARGKS